MRKTFKPLVAATVLAGLLLPFAPAESQWVFVTRKALGRIHQMTEGQQNGCAGYDFATVILDASADRVFAVALDHARRNSAVRILMQDPGARRLQIAEGDRMATLNVVPFNDDVSQLMIAGHAGQGESSTAPIIVQAVLRICKELNKHCELGGWRVLCAGRWLPGPQVGSVSRCPSPLSSGRSIPACPSRHRLRCGRVRGPWHRPGWRSAAG